MEILKICVGEVSDSRVRRRKKPIFNEAFHVRKMKIVKVAIRTKYSMKNDEAKKRLIIAWRKCGVEKILSRL